MAEITLAAEIGRPLGSAATRRLRADGKVPGVVYGHGTEAVPVAVDRRQLRQALSGQSGLNTLLSLQAGDRNFLTVARELQRDPVRGTVIHVDFQIVRRDEVIAAEVPVSLVGEAVAVQHGDGLVDQQLFSLPVRAKPADIPAVVEVDVSTLTIGGSIRVADVTLPPGVSADIDGDTAVVTGQPPRVQVVGAEAAPAAEGEAAPAAGGEEAAAAEGEAAPAAEGGGEGDEG